MIFYILLAIIAAVLLYMYLEAGWLKVERHDFSKNRTGLKIMHITDLHIYLSRISASRLRKVVVAENPDIILLSGDYIDKPAHVARFLKYLQTFSSGYRTVLCLGNHDLKAFHQNKSGLDRFLREIEGRQAEVLRNRTIVVEKSGKMYNIIGLKDLREGIPNLSKIMAGCAPDAPKIAMTHNPDLALHIPGGSVDYLFCGHFHGGQMWMPFNLEFFLLRKEQLCRMGYKRGIHKINGMTLYLNRGLGNVVVPMRLFSRPEVFVCIIP